MSRFCGIGALLLLFATSSTVLAVPVGVDDFEDGSTMGWIVGSPAHPAPPTNIASGGPGGAGDAFLRITATGSTGPGMNPGSRLSAQNFLQWTGNFAGFTSITMDVNNFGPSDLVLRLLFVNFPVAGPPTDVAWTLAPVAVPAGSGWTSVAFDLSGANLFAPFGSVAGAIGDVNEMRIFHNTVPAFLGPGFGAEPVSAVLGVDNIAAVPEPTTLVLLGAGVIGALTTRRRHRRI
jgi:hypothetical protein